MILLTDTTETLNLVTLAAGSLDYTVYYADHTANTFTANSSHGTVASITSTPMALAPDAGVQRQIKTVVIMNTSTAPTAQTVIVTKVVAGVETYLTPNTVLGTGESLEYLERRGWKVLHRRGGMKCHTAICGPVPAISTGPLAAHIGLSSRTASNLQCWAIYVGKSPRYPVTQASVRWRVTTAAVGTTWAELGLYVGSAQHGANATSVQSVAESRCVGYADIASNIAAIGIYSTTITTMTGYVIPPDEDVWIMFNTEVVLGTAAILGASQSDDLASGAILLPSSTARERRPSTDLGQAIGLQALVSVSVPPTFQIYW